MASISEPDRAKLFIALTNSLGNDEAQTLSSALNLDNQLATRDELRTEIMAVREDIRALDAKFAAVDSRLTSLDAQFDHLEMKMDLRFSESDLKMDLRFSESDAKMDLRFAESDAKMDRRFLQLDVRFADFESKLASSTRNLFIQLLGLQLSAAALVVAVSKFL
jgi:predicted nuclease with TOPRIM domain